MSPLVKLRPYQQASFRRPEGILGRIWRRQTGKSFALGAEAIDVMLATPGITTIFMSASMKLGQENLRKEAEVWRTMVQQLREAGQHIDTNADDNKGSMLDADKVADLLDHSKLEVKIWHDRSTYSRSIVIAPNPGTAVGFTGWLFLDEVGRMPQFRDVWEACEPFAASNPDFKIRLSTTPPPSDDHYSYEILSPPIEAEFDVNPSGNWYRSSAGFLMHRVDAWDAQAAGVPIYDSETREPLTPEQARAKAWDKDAWDRNFGTIFLRNTGAAAISSADMDNAQALGKASDVGEAIALFEQLPQNNQELEALVRSYLPSDWTERIQKRKIGLGLDLATSDKTTSNPSALCVMEYGDKINMRLMLAFKSRDEDVTNSIVRIIIGDLKRAEKLSQVRGLSIDASNEVFFAQQMAKLLRGQGIGVRLIKGGENISYRGDESLAKVVTGNLYCNLYSDGRIAVPAASWMAEDHRLVRRVNGSFAATALPDGRHADTFDAGKLALWELEGRSGKVEAEAIAVGGIGRKPPRAGIKNPFARFFEPKPRFNG